MYRTESFVKFAKDYIDTELTEEQVEGIAKEVESIRKFEEWERDEKKRSNNAFDIDINAKMLNIENLMKYLSNEQEERLKSKIRLAVDLNSNLEVSNIKYNNAIGWAIKTSVPRLEEKVNEIIAILTFKDYGKSQTLLRELASLPENPVERGEYY